LRLPLYRFGLIFRPFSSCASRSNPRPGRWSESLGELGLPVRLRPPWRGRSTPPNPPSPLLDLPQIHLLRTIQASSRREFTYHVARSPPNSLIRASSHRSARLHRRSASNGSLLRSCCRDACLNGRPAQRIRPGPLRTKLGVGLPVEHPEISPRPSALPPTRPSPLRARVAAFQDSLG
jgi:hypothetical protein